jgi:hypothetical protein
MRPRSRRPFGPGSNSTDPFCISKSEIGSGRRLTLHSFLDWRVSLRPDPNR